MDAPDPALADGASRAAALHAGLLTIDSHIDIAWPRPAAGEAAPRDRRVDFPKMRAGHVVAGCFAAYVPQGREDEAGLKAARERALGMLEAIVAMPEAPEGGARRVVSAAEVEAAGRDGVLAVMPAVENGHALGGDLSLLARFRASGARYLTLTHNGHNLLADSSVPRADLGDAAVRHGGLSGFGREAVAELNRLGMLVDVSHAAPDTMLQAARLSRTPVCATHSCVRALCDHPRNMSDIELDALRDTGGLIQITAVPSFLKAKASAEQVTLDDFCNHVDYVVKRCGVAHVGIGSDFDGGGGFRGWRDASESANLTAALVARGYGDTEIAQMWGGNFLRLLRLAEDAAA